MKINGQVAKIQVRAIRDGGVNRSIIGRNTFQRPKAGAPDMLNPIIKIYKDRTDIVGR